jgi:site-specific DNA-methyltransferase (adenine-specific)
VITDVLEGRARWALEHGDCLDVMRRIPDRSIDHVITDPPYEKQAHKTSRRSQRGPASLRKSGAGFVEFPIDFEAMDPATRWMCGKHFARLARRWVIVFCQLEGARRWRKAGKWYGLEHRRTCVWVKPNGAPQFTGDRPGTGYECFEAMHAKGRSRWNGRGTRGVFTFNCNSQTRNPDEDHQTPKPLDLMLKLVELFTDPDDIILDPFVGSGTTMVAALRLGRRVIGFERDARYHALALEYVSAELAMSTVQAARMGQRPLFPSKETPMAKNDKKKRKQPPPETPHEEPTDPGTPKAKKTKAAKSKSKR